MFSLREMGIILLAAGLCLVNAGRAVQVGVSWLGLTVRWWEATISVAVAIALISLVVSLLRVPREAPDA